MEINLETLPLTINEFIAKNKLDSSDFNTTKYWEYLLQNSSIHKYTPYTYLDEWYLNELNLYLEEVEILNKAKMLEDSSY